MTDKEKKEIELILGCVFLQIKDGPLDSVWDVYDEFEKQFKHFIDSLQEEPVSERFAFKAIPRLLEMIEPTDRAKAYIAKLADTLDVEGYSTDAKIVRESLKIMNGEKVPMATMDKEPVSEPNEQLAETYLAVFDKKFPILPTLKGKQLADYKNFLNKCQQIFGLKEWGIRPTQAKLFEKLSLLWAAWGVEHLQGVGRQDKKEQDIPVSEDLEEAAENFANEVEEKVATPQNPCFDEATLHHLRFGFVQGAHWQKEKDYKDGLNNDDFLTFAYMDGMEEGKKEMREQMIKNIWKSADGDDLPEIDREVIVLTQKYPLKGSEYAVSFAHRPYKGKYIGKSLTTGNIETFENKTYDKGGWNIPDVKFWLDAELPKEIKL